MGTDKITSLIRHFLTALGTLLLFLGLGKYTGLVTYLLDNMDGIIASVSSLVGVVSMIFGFFKNGSRFSK